MSKSPENKQKTEKAISELIRQTNNTSQFPALPVLKMTREQEG